MGARSLTEPSEIKPVISFIDQQYKDLDFTMDGFDVQVVIPTRTFLEKALLLHEEFSKPTDKIRTERLTRHFYDLEKIMQSDFGEKAISDDQLFETIVEHRKSVTPIRGLDYSNHQKGKLSILPPDTVIKKWEDDYKTMQENMLVGNHLNWEDLLKEIKNIENKLNKLD